MPLFWIEAGIWTTSHLTSFPQVLNLSSSTPFAKPRESTMLFPLNCCFGPLLLALVGQVSAPEKPKDAPLPPLASSQRMQVEAGLKVSLIASEPEILQPIALATDAKGRLWVAECFSYPMWLADPSKGKDRVTVLEDKDGDGTFETKKVFLNNCSNLSGIAVGMGGVWLCSTPNLIFVPDADADGVADGPAKIVLTGFDLSAKHNVSCALKWGPDGWLWGCNGILSNSKLGAPGTPDKDRLSINCGVWRYHPTQGKVAAVTHGTTNPWGLDFDQWGEAFITNCVISHVWHAQPGARLERMFGNDLNPHAYGLIPSIADHLHWGGGHWTSSRGGKGVHSNPGGGHAHAGAAILSGKIWSEEMRNSILMLNIHGNRLNRDKLIQDGATYIASHRTDPVQSPDPWFRGVSLTTGPDDLVYFSDWSDTGECHNYDKADMTNGRVYRLAPASYSHQKAKDLTAESDLNLAKIQDGGGEWNANTARIILQERATKGAISAEAIQWLRGDYAPELTHVRRLWTLFAIGKLDREHLAKRMKNKKQPRLVGWAYRLAGEMGLTDLVVTGCQTETDPWVRGVLVSTATGLSGEAQSQAALGLLTGPAFTQQTTRLMHWYAAEPSIAKYPSVAEQVISTAKDSLLVQYGARRVALVSNYDKETSGTDWLLEKLLQKKVAAGAEQGFLLGLNESLSQPGTPLPQREKVDALLLQFQNSTHPGTLGEVAKLAQFTKTPKAWDLTRVIVENEQLPLSLRQEILAQPRIIPNEASSKWLVSMGKNPDLRLSSWVTRARFKDESLPEEILTSWKNLPIIERQQALELLVERPVWTNKLLDALESDKIAPRDIPVHIARQIALLPGKEFALRIEKNWGSIRPSNQDKVKRLGDWKTKLAALDLKTANLTDGAKVYEQSCGACHKLFGKGASLGPDLTGGQRQSLDYWAENLVDPSAIVPKEYKLEVLELKNGRVISGAVQIETPLALTVRTTTETITISPSELETRRVTNQSLMPEGQLERFTPKELVDLLGYLMTKEGAK